MRTNPSLLRILLVKLVVDFPAFYRNGIKPRRGKRFHWICGLRVKHPKSEIDVVAGEGNYQPQNKSQERTFRE
ncbi:MAG TPA: hypothetical protein VLA42_04480 [Verrucomicrobiae bacterium]|nr:hypothetical protein [Verrucomicrobiae bacterium]